MNTHRSTTNTKKTIKYKYRENEIDYFYTSWKNYGFLVPVNETSTCKYLRVDNPKNGIQGTMSIAYDYLMDNVIESIINKTSIKKYCENYIISVDDSGFEKLWSLDELKSTYGESQIKYIKSCVSHGDRAYNLNWKYKEFPVL